MLERQLLPAIGHRLIEAMRDLTVADLTDEQLTAIAGGDIDPGLTARLDMTRTRVAGLNEEELKVLLWEGAW